MLTISTVRVKNAGMSGGFSFDGGDHVHSSAMENTRPVATVPFHYPADEPQPESTVPLDVATAALSEIVDWTCSGKDSSMVAARCFTVQTWLGSEPRFRSLNQIATHCDVSRAALSKSLLGFRERHSVRLTIGRLQSSRQIFAEAQRLSVANGTHFQSQKKKDTIPSPGDSMDPKRIDTLDKARTEIERLESELASTKKPQILSQPTPSPSKSPPPKLESLSLAELEECMKISNRRHDSDMVKTLVAEWHRRKGR